MRISGFFKLQKIRTDKNFILGLILQIKKALISKQSFRSWAPKVTKYYRMAPAN